MQLLFNPHPGLHIETKYYTWRETGIKGHIRGGYDYVQPGNGETSATGQTVWHRFKEKGSNKWGPAQFKSG